MPRFLAALFDIDGTLLDTTEFIHRAFEHTLLHHELPVRERAAIAHIMGKSLLDCYAALAPGFDAALLCDTHRTYQTKNLELARPYPATQSTLAKLRAEGIKLAAITTRSKRTSVDTLRLSGIDGYFDAILSGEDVEHLKPHPEPLLKALAILKLPPASAVMIGDTTADVLAGKNAGTATVGVTYGFHGEAIREAGPDYVIGDVAEVLPIVLG